MTTPFKVAVVGDVHLHFNHHDVAFFNASDYDALLFVEISSITVAQPFGM